MSVFSAVFERPVGDWECPDLILPLFPWLWLVSQIFRQWSKSGRLRCKCSIWQRYLSCAHIRPLWISTETSFTLICADSRTRSYTAYFWTWISHKIRYLGLSFPHHWITWRKSRLRDAPWTGCEWRSARRFLISASLTIPLEHEHIPGVRHIARQYNHHE